MKFGEIVKEILRVVDDDRYTETAIKSLVNEAVLSIASGRMYSFRLTISPPLPRLYTTDTVLTVAGDDSLTLPADFNRDVVQVLNSDSEIIPIPSLRKFLRLYPEQVAGAVFRCAIKGNKLFYRDIPTVAETLTVHYYKNPATLTLDDDIPDCIPVQLHRSLIVPYVCREVFNVLDANSKGKSRAKKYEAMFLYGMDQLYGFLPEDGDPEYYNDTTEYS